MASYELGSQLQGYQATLLLQWLETLGTVGNIPDGHTLITNRDLTASEQAALQGQVTIVLAAVNSAAQKASADAQIRNYWDRPLDGMTITQVQAIIVQANREMAVQFATLDTTVLANYRTAINQTLLVLNNLPASFKNEFTAERTAQGLGASAAGADVLACRTWHLLVRGWIAGAALWIAAAKQAGVSD